jgi:hypothetical protein
MMPIKKIVFSVIDIIILEYKCELHINRTRKEGKYEFIKYKY